MVSALVYSCVARPYVSYCNWENWLGC